MSYLRCDFPNTHFYDDDLRELLCAYRKLLTTLESLENWKTEHEQEYEELKKLYDDLLAGKFTPEMESALYKWTTKNTVDIIGKAIKTVFFGLSDDGYFVAYVPESWSQIRFGTSGLDTFPAGVEFGHLVLKY